MIKKLWSWLVTVIKETLNLSWTLVGLVIATLTLTGSAQQVTGLATVITLAIWLSEPLVLEKELTYVMFGGKVNYKLLDISSELMQPMECCL